MINLGRWGNNASALTGLTDRFSGKLKLSLFFPKKRTVCRVELFSFFGLFN
jgi:hypothetical protein